MNKTKKDKYLRKNRHGKNSKHKHKTRKVQRGGKVLGVINTDAGVRVETQPPDKRDFLTKQGPPLLPVRPAELNNAIEERKARAQPPTAAEEATPAPAEAPAASTQAPAAASTQAQAEAAAAETLTTAAEASQPEAAAAAANPEAMDTFYGQSYYRSINKPTSSAAPPPDAVTTASHTGNDTTTTEIKPTNEERDANFKKKADEEIKMTERADPRFSLLTNTFPNWIMGKFSSIGHDSQVKLGEEIILTDFLKNIGNHIKKTKNQIEEVEYFNDLLLKAIQELHKTNDMSPENLDKFNLYIKQIDYNNMFINKTLSDVRTTYEGAIKSGVLQPMPEKPSSPGFFDKIKNTLKGNQKVPNEQNETPVNEKPSFTQRVKKGVSNMGKTVKKAATSAKGAIMRITKKNNKVSPEIEMQELPQNPGGNDGSQSSTVLRPPVPPRPKKFPSSESSSSSESALSQQSTVGNNGSPTSTGGEMIIGLPPKLQLVTRPDGLPNKSLPPLPSLNQQLPLSPSEPTTESPQGGGNKTRKNRQHQYIHEIKQNRTHLFNKEMEILNSIRNFKNGHIDNDNTKKQFMKAVKRG